MNLEPKLYTLETLKYIHTQAEGLMNETSESYRQVNNKSYVLMAFYISIESFLVANLNSLMFFYVFAIILFSIPIIKLFKNIKPSDIYYTNSSPSSIDLDYYKDIDRNDHLNIMLSAKIEALHDCINENGFIVKNRIDNFKKSVEQCLYCFGGLTIVYIVILFFQNAQP